MNSIATYPARSLQPVGERAYRPYYDEEPTLAIGVRPLEAPRSSKLTKVAAIAVFAAVAALGAEGAWLLSHHDVQQAAPAPAAHTVSPASAPIAIAGTPTPTAISAPAKDTAPTGISSGDSYPTYADGATAPAVSSPPAEAPVDSATSQAQAPVSTVPVGPAPQGPVISIVLPALPPANDGTTSSQGGQTGGQSGSGTGGNSGGSASGGAASKPSGIGTSHLKDQEEVRGLTPSDTNPLPGSTGSFGNTAANPGGTPAGTSKVPSAAQRLFP